MAIDNLLPDDESYAVVVKDIRPSYTRGNIFGKSQFLGSYDKAFAKARARQYRDEFNVIVAIWRVVYNKEYGCITTLQLHMVLKPKQ